MFENERNNVLLTEFLLAASVSDGLCNFRTLAEQCQDVYKKVNSTPNVSTMGFQWGCILGTVHSRDSQIIVTIHFILSIIGLTAAAWVRVLTRP